MSSSSTPIKIYVKELGNICINCGSSNKENRRIVIGEDLDLIYNLYGG
jgi:hypothetical protein